MLKRKFHDAIKVLPNFLERHSRGERIIRIRIVDLKNLSLDFEEWEGTAI